MAAAKNKTAQTAVPQIDEAIEAGLKAAETAVKTNADAAQKGFDTVVSMGREAIDNACKAAAELKGLENVADLPKANFEAMVEAGSVFVKGFESLNGRMLEIARAQIAQGVDTQKALFGAKTVQEAVEIQQGFVKTSFDRAVQDGVELSNAWMKVATDAGQPIGQRLTDVMQEAGKAV